MPDRHKVDEFLDAPDELRFEVTEVTHPAADPLPGLRGIGKFLGWPPERAANPGFPINAARDPGPRGHPEPLRLHRLPDVNVGVANDQHVRPVRAACDRVSDPRLLRPRHEVVEQDTSAPVRPRLELREHALQVIRAVEQLDHDPLDPQVIAPHLLDELRIVTALNKDPARHRDACALLRRSKRARSGAAPHRRTRWGHKLHGLPVNEKPISERKRAHSAVEILKLEHAVARVDHRAAKLGQAVLNHEPLHERDLLALHGPPTRLHPGNRVVVVAVI